MSLFYKTKQQNPITIHTFFYINLTLRILTMAKIVKVIGREIIDSRGNPTVEAEVHLEGVLLV